MSHEERVSRVEWLASLGVPAAFHDAIIDAPTGWLIAAGGVVLGLGMVAGAIGATVAAFFWLDGHVHAQAMALAQQTGATLIHVNVGIGPLLLMFGLLGLMGWAGGNLSGRYRVNGFPSSAASMINKPPPPGFTRTATRWVLSGSVRRAAAKAASVEAFLLAMVGDQARRWGIGAAVLLAPAVVLTVLETNNYWVAGPSGIIEHRLLPPFSSRTYDLASATALITGCNHTDKGEYLHYDLEFASGASFNLGNAKGVSGRSAPAVEQIDAKLERAIHHQRWSHLDRDPVHPACLRYWGAQLGQFGQGRLAKMLRLTPQELDRGY